MGLIFELDGEIGQKGCFDGYDLKGNQEVLYGANQGIKN